MLRFRIGTSQRLGRRTSLFEGFRVSRYGIRPYFGVSRRIGKHARVSLVESFGRHASRHKHHYLLGLLLCILAIVVLAHIV